MNREIIFFISDFFASLTSCNDKLNETFLNLQFTDSCQFIKCSNGKTCIEDQESHPQCVKCPRCSTKPQNLTKQVVEKMVCGMDGVTYRSMCELREKACKIGKVIAVLKRGPCTGKF
jgi:hypothetical protein